MNFPSKNPLVIHENIMKSFFHVTWNMFFPVHIETKLHVVRPRKEINKLQNFTDIFLKPIYSKS